MGSHFQIVFLGTGGGRFITITQRRRTAGIRIVNRDVNLHLDPGPGALVHSISEGLDPQKLNAVLVSHCHPDHYTDAEVLIEAMTRGGTRRRGLLGAAVSVLNGSSNCEASISKYHQGMPERRIEAEPGTKFEVGSLTVSATEARHTDPDAVGFRFGTAEFGDFAYTSDTEYYKDIARYYQDLRILILCTMRPSGNPWKGHMTTDDATKIIQETRPEQVFLTHLGMKMLLEGPAKEAKLIQEKTGVPTTAAADGMVVSLSETVTVRKPDGTDQQGLPNYFY